MAAAIEGDVTITDGKKIDRDIEARKNVITRAYSEIGGIPKNHLKTSFPKCLACKRLRRSPY